MRHRAFFRFNIISGAMIIFLVSACTATPISAPESSAQATPEVTIQGDTPGREEIQTIELDNCGGKADATRIEQRTQSIDVTISTEIAAKIGASVEVVSAEVQAAVGLALTPGSERSTSIQLVAPPDTRMVFELVWVGNEQIGVVQNIRDSDVPVAFRSFLPTDVRIRSQSDIGCSGSSSPQVVFDPTASPQTSVSTIEAGTGDNYCYGGCWQYDDNARTMTWIGPTDGTEDIWQPPGEALQNIQAGYTAIFNTSVPGEIFACVLTINGTFVKDTCGGVLYEVVPGTFQVTSANRDVGGFRWCPAIEYGWRANGGECK